MLSALVFSLAAGEAPKVELFVAQPLTDKNNLTPRIEGSACDAVGNVYVVNLKKNGDGPEKNLHIARVTRDGKVEVLLNLPDKNVGNGIVFDKKGLMYVADYTGHNVLRIDPKTKNIEVCAHEPEMNQPNDLAIGPVGTRYASDPDWGRGPVSCGSWAPTARPLSSPATWERPTASM